MRETTMTTSRATVGYDLHDPDNPLVELRMSPELLEELREFLQDHDVGATDLGPAVYQVLVQAKRRLAAYYSGLARGALERSGADAALAETYTFRSRELLAPLVQ